MSAAALLRLRDDIGKALAAKADALKTELKAIGADYADVGRIAVYGKKSLAGRKVAPKYRDPQSKATWAGRGGMPGWMREALKSGRKREDFLIKPKAVKKTAKKRKKPRS
jgi:DNA-binding protein H-NS